jgi:hypothetical protein
MNLKLLLSLGLALLAAGCGTSSKHDPTSVDQLLGTTAPAQGGFVYISGEVRRNVIPWVDGMTLRRAFALAGYQGPSSGMRLGVLRNRERPLYTDLQDLYRGQDLLLEPGDRIQIEPKPK